MVIFSKSSPVTHDLPLAGNDPAGGSSYHFKISFCFRSPRNLHGNVNQRLIDFTHVWVK